MYQLSQVVPKQTQPVPLVASKRYVLLLLDSFSAFDLTTVIEALKDANRMRSTLRYEWTILSEGGEACTASNGMSFNVESGLIQLNRHDTLIVFGGDEFASTSTLPVMAWLRRQDRLGATIGGISGAVYLLIKAGLFRDTEVATHWSYRHSLCETFRDIDVGSAVFKFAENRFTCAGGVATLDLMLQLISSEQGVEVSTWVADSMVCSMPRTECHDQIFSLSTRIGERNAKVTDAIRIMQNTLEHPISPSKIADRIGISARQQERLFTKFLKATPKAYYLKLRLEHAHRLLLQTEMKTIEIAIACGFGSTGHFSKLYKKHFGISPHRERGFGAAAELKDTSREL